MCWDGNIAGAAAAATSVPEWQLMMASLQTFDVYIEYESMAYAHEELTIKAWFRPFAVTPSPPSQSSSSGVTSRDASELAASSRGVFVMELCRINGDKTKIISRALIGTRGHDHELHSSL
jgi:hypothetical protein